MVQYTEQNFTAIAFSSDDGLPEVHKQSQASFSKSSYRN